MNKYKNYYIAFLDLLGFKNIIKEKRCDDVVKCFDEIKHKSTVSVNETGLPLFDHSQLKRFIMSDSICIFIEIDVKNSLAGLISFCDYFQVRMASLEEPILVRGAITQGELYYDNDVIFVPGLVKGYLMQEQTAKYPRIILVKSLLDKWNNYDEYGMDYLSKHTFYDNDEFLAVDYLYLFYGLRNQHESWKRFVKTVEYKLDNEVDNSIREKYLYIWNDIPRAKNKAEREMDFNL